jgi:hypothetical protein
MGNIFFDPFETKNKVKLNELEQGYFNNINRILRDNYKKYEENDNNYLISFEKKSFSSSQSIGINPEDLDYITWYDYIYDYITRLYEKDNQISWVRNLLEFLDKDDFFNQHKYQSIFFYQAFYLNTFPQILKNDNEDDELFSLEDKEKNITNYTELSITSNLGGSFLEINTDELLDDSPDALYKKERINVKEHVKIFKDHIYDNRDHPINKIIHFFCKYFSNYIKDEIKKIENNIQQTPSQSELYLKEFKDLEENITLQLQDFIINMQCTLKFYYCNVMDYNVFANEKDELINLITNLIFKTGKLYDTIYDLYLLSMSDVVKKLEDKLLDLKDVKPGDLGIQIKFCLDDETLKLQQSILKDKRIEREKKKLEEGKDNKEEKDNLNNQLELITEELEDRKRQSLDDIKEEDDDKGNQILYEEDDNNIDTSSKKKINNQIPKISPSRYTVNSFNNKKFNFPKLHQITRDTLAKKDEFIQDVMENDKNLIPYSSAINILRGIKKYKTPFEKMLIIASISDQITECCTVFWKEMEKYIKNDFLSIEGDELMTIFLYIIIKSQMPEISIFAKMIKNFTTSTTKLTTIGYYYSTLEATIVYIEQLTDTKEVIKRNDQLRLSRVSLANMIH